MGSRGARRSRTRLTRPTAHDPRLDAPPAIRRGPMAPPARGPLEAAGPQGVTARETVSGTAGAAPDRPGPRDPSRNIPGAVRERERWTRPRRDGLLAVRPPRQA